MAIKDASHAPLHRHSVRRIEELTLLARHNHQPEIPFSGYDQVFDSWRRNEARVPLAAKLAHVMRT
jgi:hypothetical protein